MRNLVSSRPIAFLFLGETLLIPHLYPIVEALAAEAPEIAIECWCATSVHLGLLTEWLEEAGLASRVRLRRAPGFVSLTDLQRGQNPPLPAKLPMLIRLIPYLLRTRAVVCAEQTSLWIPTALPFLPMRFIKTSHGVGSMSARDDRRRRAAYRMLVPSDHEKATYTVRNYPDERLVVTGYVKASFRGLARPPRLFRDDKPVVVYAPHWQRERSSWWKWGRQIVAMLSEQDRWNVILAPHQRLPEQDATVIDIIHAAASHPHIHADHDSFATVDGSYMAAADLYLGDTSSQVVEFLARPRPCVFLNAQQIDWRETDDHGFWNCGEVVEKLSEAKRAIERASSVHPDFLPVQERLAQTLLGDTTALAPTRAARAVLSAIH